MRLNRSYLAGIFAGLIVSVLFFAGLFSGPEYFFEDLLFSPRPISPEIVIVAIDNKSLVEFGQWPWRREVFADFLEKLNNAHPRVLGLDVIFADSSRYGEADDLLLSRAFGEAKYPIVVPVEAEELSLSGEFPRAKSFIRTREQFISDSDNVREALVNVIIDADGVVRRVPNFVLGENGEKFDAFSLSILGRSATESVSRVAYSGIPGSVSTISFADFMASSEVGKLSGRYVLLGVTAPDLHDEQMTPVSGGRPMSGVEIEAQVVNMFLLEYSLKPISDLAILLWIILASLMPALFLKYFSQIRVAFLCTVFLLFGNFILAFLLFEKGLIPNLVHTSLAIFLGFLAAFGYRYLAVEKERREIKHAFSKYVSRDVLSEILRNISMVRLGGEEKVATVFFSDVRGFTTLSETLSPTELTSFLNRYLTVMTDIVLKHRGVVDKYIGDAIMSFWGAPLENKKSARDAIVASLEMANALREFNKESVGRGDPEIDIGIGLNTGHVVAGNMGSEQRFDYTVMGDTVNLASRLEGQTKTYGVKIIASEATVASLSAGDVSENGILFREIDKVCVKGKKLPVTIYEVVERAKMDRVAEIRELFEDARENYYAGNWGQCVALCEKILATGEDGPTSVLLCRAKHFMEKPPATWEGVFELKTK